MSFSSPQLISRIKVISYHTGEPMDNYFIQMAIIIGSYSMAILVNLLVLWSARSLNQWLIIPWLIFYSVIIFLFICASPVIVIWFVWIQPEPIWALLSLVTLFVALILICFWIVMQKFFVWVSEEKSSLVRPFWKFFWFTRNFSWQHWCFVFPEFWWNKWSNVEV